MGHRRGEKTGPPKLTGLKEEKSIKRKEAKFAVLDDEDDLDLDDFDLVDVEDEGKSRCLLCERVEGAAGLASTRPPSSLSGPVVAFATAVLFLLLCPLDQPE